MERNDSDLDNVFINFVNENARNKRMENIMIEHGIVVVKILQVFMNMVIVKRRKKIVNLKEQL